MSYRYVSLLRTKLLDLKFDTVKNFELSKLNVLTIQNSSVEHLRLGKQIERWVALAIKESNRYDVVLENIQVYKGKITIGEFDFILRDIESKRFIHLELVYKFYLYLPSQGLNEIHKWIGPNLKDSLIKKVEKLKNKQFPLLYKKESKSVLGDIDIKNIDQNLCFMANLFVPFGLENESYKDINNEAISGYWYNITDFLMQFEFNFFFYLPIKSEWGINPKYNLNWLCFEDIVLQINKCHSRKFSPLCWIKDSKGKFSQCFIVWW